MTFDSNKKDDVDPTRSVCPVGEFNGRMKI